MRAIVFDLDGTLLRFTEDYETILAGTFEAVAGEVREAWLDAYERTFYDLFGAHEPEPVRRAFAVALEAGAEPGEGSDPGADDAAVNDAAADDVAVDDAAADDAAVNDASVDDGTVADLVAVLREREAATCEPPDGAAADLARLADDHALAVLTDGLPTWQVHKLRANGLAEPFDRVVTSYEVGAHKPDPAAFRAVEERLPAERYAMVGDDEAADVEGARAAGWAAHRYEGGGFGDLPGAIEWE